MRPYYLFTILACFYFSCNSNNIKKPIVSSTNKNDSASLSNLIQDSLVGSSKANDITYPPYGLEKIKNLIANIKSVDDTTGEYQSIESLDKQTYASLTLEEKFTYNMIHPDVESQICDILPERTYENKRIYGQMPNIFGEHNWSDDQINFLKNNHDSVEKLMKAVIEKEKHIGGNFKEAIVEMNATDMIPYLVSIYNIDKDHYILTVLLLLMYNNKYPEFMNSVSYKKLYDSNNEYSSYLTYNKANEQLIIQRATNFYNGLSHK